MFSAAIIKKNMHHAVTLSTTMPLQLQALVEHFDAECRTLNRTGMLVADWSSHHQDQHASRCVASFAASRRLAIHPCVYYASSHSNEGTQVADLVAGIRRRVSEGDQNLDAADLRHASIQRTPCTRLTVEGRQFTNWITLF